MIIIERVKVPIICSECGRTIRPGQECVRTGDGVLCATCHDDVQDLADHVAGRRTTSLILRIVRRWWRRWA